MTKTDKKNRKIPFISADRIDLSPANTSVGTSKKEQTAHAFVKGKEPVQSFTTRLPMDLYDELRELAFKQKIKINHVILRLVRDYVKEKK